MSYQHPVTAPKTEKLHCKSSLLIHGTGQLLPASSATPVSPAQGVIDRLESVERLKSSRFVYRIRPGIKIYVSTSSGVKLFITRISSTLPLSCVANKSVCSRSNPLGSAIIAMKLRPRRRIFQLDFCRSRKYRWFSWCRSTNHNFRLPMELFSRFNCLRAWRGEGKTKQYRALVLKVNSTVLREHKLCNLCSFSRINWLGSVRNRRFWARWKHFRAPGASLIFHHQVAAGNKSICLLLSKRKSC